jgi:hypothetical protein
MKEALKLALEALTYCEALNKDVEQQKMQAIAAIKEALAQPEQKPVAWMHEWEDGERIPLMHNYSSDNDKPVSVRPLVFGDTTLPAAQPVQGATLQEQLQKANTDLKKARDDVDKARAVRHKARADVDKALIDWDKAYAEVARTKKLIEEQNT